MTLIVTALSRIPEASRFPDRCISVDRLIILNGHEFAVPRNVYNALLKFRGFGALGLWLNQICIYLDRSRTNYCGNLRVDPLFCERFGSCIDPDRYWNVAALSHSRHTLQPPLIHLGGYKTLSDRSHMRAKLKHLNLANERCTYVIILCGSPLW